MRPAVYQGGTKAGPDRAAEVEPKEDGDDDDDDDNDDDDDDGYSDAWW